MKKIRWKLGIGFIGPTRSGIIEFDDDATDEEIIESVIDAENYYINIDWEAEEQDDG
ncbi:hypothetical protein RWV98_02880 [Agathobaculum sp. NTUH-O15-33]|uniref:hypothetical protein n=1 Tax=Agathobaculum sp. NTUH-O15-33 TaxID=3079302 RepID=UPI002958383F|nr:hypothetical protein [Agathobaculum sp. NTUH-O15-33]WNX85237.1 hypothetical protein RWV98_02880 [Agathobaculum sp. NTUH-O15-33]